MYTSMEGGVFELVHNLKRCPKGRGCEMCDAVTEQIEQQYMRELLTPPPPKKGQLSLKEPFRFVLPLKKPMCDNTTKFSKWITEKKPHLSNHFLVCAAHLTGIAWQKKTHRKYFDSDKKYQTFYKLVVRATKCASIGLASVIQGALVQWLRDNGETSAATWFQKYWTESRGNWTLAHGGIGGTNNNNGTEGNWGGLKKAVLGTAGSTAGLPVRTVIPSLLRFLKDKSKEEASYWRKETRARSALEHSQLRPPVLYAFPSIPLPNKGDWDGMQSLHPQILQSCYVTGSADVITQWEGTMAALTKASEEDGLTNDPPHIQVENYHSKGHKLLPPRTSIGSIIMPTSSCLLNLAEVDDADRVLRVAAETYRQLMQNPAAVEAANPSWTVEKYLDLHDGFHLIEMLEERWGRWVICKCTCPDFFGAGCCRHSNLMALLFDSTLEVPSAWSSKQLPHRPGRSKKPSAWAEHHEEEDEIPRGQHWAPRHVGGGLIISGKGPQVFIVSPACWQLPPDPG